MSQSARSRTSSAFRVLFNCIAFLIDYAWLNLSCAFHNLKSSAKKVFRQIWGFLFTSLSRGASLPLIRLISCQIESRWLTLPQKSYTLKKRIKYWVLSIKTFYIDLVTLGLSRRPQSYGVTLSMTQATSPLPSISKELPASWLAQWLSLVTPLLPLVFCSDLYHLLSLVFFGTKSGWNWQVMSSGKIHTLLIALYSG